MKDFTATGTYSDGSSEDITFMVTWDSNAPNIMTLEPSGEATCANVGVAQVTATYAGITSKAIQITVVPLSSIDVEPASPADLAISSTQQFIATGTFSDGSTADITPHVTSYSSDTRVATIDAWGKVTVISAGSTQITANFAGITSSSISLNCVISADSDAVKTVLNYLTSLSLSNKDRQTILNLIVNNVLSESADTHTESSYWPIGVPTNDWVVDIMLYVDPGAPEPITNDIPVPLSVIEGTNTYVSFAEWSVSPSGIVTPLVYGHLG